MQYVGLDLLGELLRIAESASLRNGLRSHFQPQLWTNDLLQEPIVTLQEAAAQ